MDVQAWYDRVVKTVSQSGQAVSVVRMLCAQQTWHVWSSVREPEEFASECSAIVADLSEQWPARRWQVTLLAEDKSGQVLSQCPFEVMGKNKSAQNAMAGGDSVKVHVEAMENIQRTWERTLAVVNEQMAIQTTQLREQGKQFVEMMAYVTEAEKYRATEPTRLAELAGVAAKDPLKEQLVEAFPQLLELASKLIDQRQAAKTAAAANAAAGAVPLKAVATAT